MVLGGIHTNQMYTLLVVSAANTTCYSTVTEIGI